MAKIDLKFIDTHYPSDYIQTYVNPEEDEQDTICITGWDGSFEFAIILDKSTAIKFAKTLRTEINKIED